MSKLKAIFSKNCNYIYHMMSVSKCGYDNEYGNKYRIYHAQTDLQVLNKYEKLITIKGGEHIGELYGFCVSAPALLDDNVSLDNYFEALIDIFENGDFEKNLEKYKSVYESAFPGVPINADTQKQFYSIFPQDKKELIDIYKVLCNNYSIYNDKIWETSKKELTVAVDELNKLLSEVDYINEWEKILDYKYNRSNFYAVICNSLKGGAQCIDAFSQSKNIFNIPDNYSSAVKLISHEFGIGMLIEILSEPQAFYTYYEITESLAEYFNIIISGGHDDFNWFKEYQDFYKELREKNPQISVKDMFLQAVNSFKNK